MHRAPRVCSALGALIGKLFARTASMLLVDATFGFRSFYVEKGRARSDERRARARAFVGGFHCSVAEADTAGADRRVGVYEVRC